MRRLFDLKSWFVNTAVIATLSVTANFGHAEGLLPPLDTSADAGTTQMHAMEGGFPAGGGVYGPNRRVISEERGFLGVRGTFTVKDVLFPMYYYQDGRGVVDYYSIANSKPTFYLGCSRDPFTSADGAVEVDAGIVYEWWPVSTTSGGVVTRTRGWTAFINNQSNYIASQDTYVNAPGQWRTGASTFDLEWSFERTYGNLSYRGYLQVTPRDSSGNALSAFPSNAGGAPGYLYANGGNRLCVSLSGMAVKRVVGISQGGGKGAPNATPGFPFTLTRGLDQNTGDYTYEEDWSLLNCDFTNGEIAPGPVNVPISWHRWQDLATVASGGVDQNPGRTGWYPDTRDMSQGSQNATGSRYIIDFPAANGQGGLPSTGLTNRSDPNPARYSEETVNIRLFPAVRSSFSPLPPGR